ncbi:MAG TPA: TonB-dependent receptor [Bryobacteraceae bacterium]|nr:TonB-dependent receptor [Bryobacteraceae bacterium]
MRVFIGILICLTGLPSFISAAVLEGIVHDPQHRPIAGARVVVEGHSPLQSDANGEFKLENIPAGTYEVTVTAPGFDTLHQTVSTKTSVIHLQLEIAGISQAIEVSGTASKLSTQTATVQTFVSQKEISQTAGTDQTNSLAMITDFTPGAYMVHDMLHVRGGHQVNWFLDGIPLENTNIATNVAQLINPKNIEELQIERGGYSSEYGDRTYGFFNVVTPSGFERDNQADLVLSAGNFYSTDDQFSVGGHTQRFAYFASVDANHSQLGLATPVPQVIHDSETGAGGFLSLLYNPSAKDQVRWIASLRDDRYQIPSSDDLELERDDLAGVHWTHSFGDGVLFYLAPYFHFNSAHYVSGLADMPYILNDNDRSDYVGGRAVLQAQKKRPNARVGTEVWGQHDNTFFGLTANPGEAVLNQQESHWAHSEAVFLEDQYKATSWLTLNLGMRFTHYAGLVNENAADPRLGGAIRIPHLNWTLHGYYAYYYQPPPLDSLAGPSLAFAIDQGYGFVPLPGERDIQHDIGIDIPLHGWSVDVDRFHTSALNFLDHDVIGNSGIFIPLTDLAATIGGTEVSIRSPRLYHRAQLRIAYSNQIAQGAGPITGGLLEFSDSDSGFFLLDHDQRNTLTTVLSVNLPHRLWMTPAWQFGSGFLNGDGPAHLPPHNTFDLSIGKSFGEAWTVSANAVNIANTRYLLDTSNTFGGTHYINPRQVYGELRYHFHL